jgi:hypothetical protein
MLAAAKIRGGGRGIGGRKSYINPNPNVKIKNELVNCIQLYVEGGGGEGIIGCDLHIYGWVNIALHMNRRVLMKHRANLYSNSILNRKNRALWFPKPKFPALQTRNIFKPS